MALAHKKHSAPKRKLIAVSAQDAVKINLEMTRLPKEFYGHNEITLFKNLQTLSKLYGRKIKGKAVYGKLTTEDYYAFSNSSSNSPAQSLLASGGGNIKYSGEVWRIRNADEFPDSELIHTDGCGIGSGRGSGTAASRDELFAPFRGSFDTWQGSVFPLRTEIPQTSRKNYKGYNVGVKCEEFYVPLRQVHYGLSFLKNQPLKLIDVTNKNRFAGYETDRIFSLDSYEFEPKNGIGFVVWQGSDVVPRDKNSYYLSTLFIVKPDAPYTASRTFTKLDKVEGKTHTAIQNNLLVNIVGVWIYDSRTGEIVSKSATDKP